MGDDDNNKLTWPAVAGSCCSAACCSWWIPLIFFLSAQHVVRETCEAPMAQWLQAYSLCLFFLTPVGHCCLVSFHKCGCTPIGLAIFIAALLSVAGLCIWGIAVRAKSTETNCWDGGGINPMTLSLIFIILGMIAWGLVILVLLCGGLMFCIMGGCCQIIFCGCCQMCQTLCCCCCGGSKVGLREDVES